MNKQSATAMARRERLEQVQADQRRRRHRRTVVVAVLASSALALAGVGLFALAGRSAPSAPAALSGVQTFAGLSRDHVAGPVRYPQTPPVGGPHAALWQNCGAYPTPVANENAVHSLEHGVVWITYRPDLRAADVTALRDLASRNTRVLVSPFPGLPAAVVATAWGVQLRLTGVQDPRLSRFVTAYDAGRTAPEPGGECTGGVGTPLR